MEKQTKPANPDRLSARELFMWPSRGFSQAMNAIILGFATIYSTDALGLNIALVGTMLMLSKILDVVTSVVFAFIVDRTKTRLGRGRPYEFFIVGFWACTVLLFSCPPGWDTFAKAAWVLAMYSAVNAIFSPLLGAAQVPYMVRAFNNPRKYVTLTSYGGLITILGAMIVNITFPVLMGTLATSAQGWTNLLLIYAIPATLIGLLRFFFIPEKYDVDVKADKINFHDVATVLRTNRHIWAVGVMVLVYQIVANMGVTVYYFTYVLKNVSLMGIFSLISLVMVPSMLLVPWLLKRVTLRNVMFWSFVLACIGSVINWFAYDSFAILLVAGLFTGLGAVPVNMLNGLMVLDCADFNEWKGQPRMEATLGAVPGLAAQVGGAAGAFLLGIFLNMGGYLSGTTEHTIEQPPSAIFMLRLLISAIPFVLYAIAAITARVYGLDKQMPHIRKENDERRALALAAVTDPGIEAAGAVALLSEEADE